MQNPQGREGDTMHRTVQTIVHLRGCNKDETCYILMLEILQNGLLNDS